MRRSRPRPLPLRPAQWIVGGTLAVTILGLPLLAGLRFDFNPLNLRDQKSESMSTLLELMNDPDTTPNTIDLLKGDLAEAVRVAEKLRRLPEVRQVITLQSFVPEDQEAKLALIEDASFFFQNTLSPDQIDPAPTPAETRAAIDKLVGELTEAASGSDSPVAVQARRLATLLAALAKAPPSAIDDAQRVFVLPLQTTLRQVRHLLTAESVGIDTLPPNLKRLWVSADGHALMEFAPKGDANDNANLSRFVAAVRAVEPDAVGTPVSIIEAADAMVAASPPAFAVAAIALILFVALRRWVDVALAVPLRRHRGALELCVLIGLKLNLANIMRCCLLGVGVAFKIYYIVAWRSGETNFLQSSLTRAIFFSAWTTALVREPVALHHPGIEHGLLMALCR